MSVVEDVDSLLDDDIKDSLGTTHELLGNGSDVGSDGANVANSQDNADLLNSSTKSCGIVLDSIH